MIATLSGRIRQKSPGNVIVEAGGIGFGVILPLSTYYALPEVGKKVFLLIHTHVREDAFTLFGFITHAEKEFFVKLINISGIGPKLAANILSGITVFDLRQAILEGNIARITSIPGVGKKTAERIILELKDKISAVTSEDFCADHKRVNSEPITADAVSALINLGYSVGKAEVAVRKVREEPGDALTLEELIKKSFKFL